MSEIKFPFKKVASIIFVTWILSLVTTLAVVYVIPDFFPVQANQKQTEIIKFYEPDEINVTGYGSPPLPLFKDVATFVWTPENPTSNAILAVYCHIEYRCENPKQFVWEWGTFWWEIKFGIWVNDFSNNDFGTITRSADNQQNWEQSHSVEWEQTCLLALPNQGIWINPNQNNYTLGFWVIHGDRASSSTPTYVRNINIILEVVDGIP